MNITSAYSGYHSASLGIQRGMQGLARNAAQLASSGQLEAKVDPIKAIVESHADRTSVRANAKVLSTIDDTLGTLLDIMA